jgi:hypothetical protein
MAISGKVGTLNKELTPSVNVGGTWKSVTEAWTNVGGTWKNMFASMVKDIVLIVDKNFYVFDTDLNYKRTFVYPYDPLRAEVSNNYINNMVTDGEFLYVQDGSGCAAKMDYEGNVIWRKTDLGSHIAVDDQHVYVSSAGSVTKLDKDGNVVWNKPSGHSWGGALAVDQNRIYVGATRYKRLTMMNKHTGAVEFNSDNWTTNSGVTDLIAAGTDGNFYVGTTSTWMYKVNSSGVIQGSQKISEDGRGTMSITVTQNNQLYVTGEYPTENLKKMDMSSGGFSLEWSKPVGWNAPSVADNEDFVYTADRSVISKWDGDGTLVNQVDFTDLMGGMYCTSMVLMPPIAAFPDKW